MAILASNMEIAEGLQDYYEDRGEFDHLKRNRILGVGGGDSDKVKRNPGDDGLLILSTMREALRTAMLYDTDISGVERLARLL